MTAGILLYTGSIIITLWGISHIIPTKSVVAGFGNLSTDNLRILTMEWVAEGLTLIFLGLLVMVATLIIGLGAQSANPVFIYAAAVLLVMAAWSAFTGARISILPIKAPPLVISLVSVLFILAVVL